MSNDEIEKWLKKHRIIDKDANTGEYKKNKDTKKHYDMTIDLHGLRLKDAEIVVKRKLKRAFELHYDRILIIHGVGLHSNGEPVLKNGIRKLINTNPYVRDFTNAPLRDGGEGAVVVYIRRR
ncbi:hypothetical protein DRP44_07090 [candidate division TA06 bacterium]|uniref:Smr domain-containing protein n=1 Tax=candidate division TA06 bacterium TaxID=2250710 RepID=A0A660S5W3_UNCT6|nr:MAG: hypothetical protein DRP44_07090 [candidate division TA06 bacterium]